MFGKIIAAALEFITGVNWNAIGQSFVKFWYLWVIALLISGNGFTGWRLYHTQLDLQQEKAAHTKDINDFKNAQELANAKAEMKRAEIIRESEADAAKADANYLNLLAKYHASLVRYKASQSGSGRPNSDQYPTTQGGDGPSTSTELPDQINITVEDAQICAVNTARLQAVHDWAVNLPK